MKKAVALFIFLSFAFSAFPEISDDMKAQARSYREEGYVLQSRGDHNGALVFYQKAIALDPAYSEAYNDMGVVLEEKGDIKGAEAMYQKALQYDPQYLPAHTNLAFIYEAAGEPQKATFHWKQRVLSSPQGDYWRQEAINHLRALGTYDEIKGEIIAPQVDRCFLEMTARREQARAETVGKAAAHLRNARALSSDRKYKEALDELNAALALDLQDEQLTAQIPEEYSRIMRRMKKEQVRMHLKSATSAVEKDEYKTAVRSLKDALSVIFSIEN